MKKMLLFSLVVLTFLSCSKTEDHSKENIALIEKYIESVVNLDSDAMDTILADDYMGYGPSFDQSINKENAISNWKNTSTDLYKSISYSKNRNIAVSIPDGENKGEWVTNWAEATIVYKDSGKEVTFWANTLYQIKNGKIVKSYTIYNEADILKQLNYTFTKE